MSPIEKIKRAMLEAGGFFLVLALFPNVAQASGDLLIVYSMGAAILLHIAAIFLFNRIKARGKRLGVTAAFLVSVLFVWYCIWNDNRLDAWVAGLILIAFPFVPAFVVSLAFGREKSGEKGRARAKGG